MAGFIQFSFKSGRDNTGLVLTTLMHDIMGLAKKIKKGDKFFSPRSSGYAKYLD